MIIKQLKRVIYISFVMLGLNTTASAKTALLLVTTAGN
jgi:hypothetical protein